MYKINIYLLILIIISNCIVVFVNCHFIVVPPEYDFDINKKQKKIPLSNEEHETAVELIRQVYNVTYDNPCAYRNVVFLCKKYSDDQDSIYYVQEIYLLASFNASTSVDFSKFKRLELLFLNKVKLEYNLFKDLYKLEYIKRIHMFNYSFPIDYNVKLPSTLYDLVIVHANFNIPSSFFNNKIRDLCIGEISDGFKMANADDINWGNNELTRMDITNFKDLTLFFNNVSGKLNSLIYIGVYIKNNDIERPIINMNSFSSLQGIEYKELNNYY